MIKQGMALALRKAASILSPIYSAAASWTTIFESNTGAWQQNVAVNNTTVSQNWAFFACVTLIAGYIGNMAADVMAYDDVAKIYNKTLLRAVLRKPNRYQTRVEFFRSWVFSLLLNGNAYILKQRDANGFITALYVLDPHRVIPLVTPSGDVYYQLSQDYLSNVEKTVIVPASEVIHDRLHTLWHPLIGVSPISACGVAAMQSTAIMDNSAKFFQNMSRPSGLLTAPGLIKEETAARLKEQWETNYSGANIGKVAVLGDGLKYEAMTVNATDAQLIEQLKFTGEMICATLHVPPYKLGLGPMPTNNNTAALNQQFYDQCLQPIIENMELRLDDGLELVSPNEVWFDTSALLRMDPTALYEANKTAVSSGWMKPDEARQKVNLPPVAGGDACFLQQQNFSLEALAKRDALDNPFGNGSPAPTTPPADTATPPVKSAFDYDLALKSFREYSNVG